MAVIPGTSPAGHELTLARLRRPDPDLLTEIAEYDREAFGALGLRSCDLAVMAEAGAVYVARIGSEVVGGCQLLRMLDEPHCFYLVGFYIRQEWQGRGVGRKLLQALIELCVELGCEGLVLTVGLDNVRALELYKSAGFAEEVFVPGFYGVGEDRVVLRARFAE
jgi:ribosomal protein S18 acetylase RimI-like enzyme